MAKNGKRYDIRAEIIKGLTEYTDEVSAEIEKAADQLSAEAVKTLKQTSPRSKKTATHYADGWTKRKIRSNGQFRIIIYNRAKPKVTHLLEFGWITKSGRRVSGRKHIYPVRDKLAVSFPKEVKRIVKERGK